ncbi:MAG TPA: tryptophan 7-halogenase [Thermoanaerobaculia bacterium]|jgi:flavin-dependent dehydrogenase|nr:tryptophan 7-halogenase [Thermoanaerobaculia bacterium]
MRFDVAIAGGGPAAAAAALLLARGGLRVVVLERGDDRGDKPGESLAPAARPLLERLGGWDGLAEDGHLPCHGNRSVWGSDGVDELPFISSPYGHGWHLDRRRFERRLNQLARDAGALRVTRTSVSAIERAGGRWRLRCPGALADVEADFVLDATGRASRIARMLGTRRIIDDPLVALVAFLESDAVDRDSYTLVEATENGWWYTAALPGNRLAAMVVTDPPAPSFVPAGHTLARIERHGYRLAAPPRVVDAGSARLRDFGGDGWLAIGDAAMSLDPLSSHGIATALHSGMLAAEAILGGERRRYLQAMEAMWDGYSSMRRAFYAAERRWPASPFWARRGATRRRFWNSAAARA